MVGARSSSGGGKGSLGEEGCVPSFGRMLVTLEVSDRAPNIAPQVMEVVLLDALGNLEVFC